jgi:hypothetical protein
LKSRVFAVLAPGYTHELNDGDMVAFTKLDSTMLLGNGPDPLLLYWGTVLPVAGITKRWVRLATELSELLEPAGDPNSSKTLPELGSKYTESYTL